MTGAQMLGPSPTLTGGQVYIEPSDPDAKNIILLGYIPPDSISQGSTGAIGSIGPQGPAGPTGAQGTGPQGPTGAVGSVGPAGAIGPTGMQGPTGVQGPTGAQGSTGTQGLIGSIGPTGLQGIQGVTGPLGPTGPQGLVGIQGIAGPSGSAGPTGADSTVPGPTGAPGTGPAGPIGPTGISDRYAATSTDTEAIPISHPTGLDMIVSLNRSYTIGQSVVVAHDINNIFWATVAGYTAATGELSLQSSSHTGSGTYGTWYVNLAGGAYTPGPTGVAGPTGTGITGAGIAGPTGPTGYVGPTGPIGPTGVGVTGVGGDPFIWRGGWLAATAYLVDDVTENDGNGFVCIANNTSTGGSEPGVGVVSDVYWEIFVQRGVPGVTGPTGPAGAAGAAGADSTAGFTGPTGPMGPTGPQGIAGADSTAGFTGPAGPIGPTGPAGATGADSTAGFTGPTGPSGAIGSQGPAGPQGPTGAQGVTGAAGDSITGPTGPVGPTGSIEGITFSTGLTEAADIVKLGDTWADEAVTLRVNNTSSSYKFRIEGGYNAKESFFEVDPYYASDGPAVRMGVDADKYILVGANNGIQVIKSGINEIAIGDYSSLLLTWNTGATDGVIIDNRVTTAGLQYEGDYSAGFQDHTLVTKSWVLAQLGSGYTFDNGLIDTASNIDIGGLLTANVQFTAGGLYNFEIGTLASRLNVFKVYADSPSIIDSQGYLLFNSSDLLYLWHNNGGKAINIGPSSILIIDNDDSKGLQYYADYSTVGKALGARWIPDWGAVTTQIGGKNVNALITTPTVTQDGYAITWNNTAAQYTLTAVSGGGGTVTSVAAGVGMNFTTITGSGTVTMGTPSSLTLSTTNLASGTTHEHALSIASFAGSSAGLVPVSVGGTVNFLRADGTWATPAGGGGIGTTGSPDSPMITLFYDPTTVQGSSSFTYNISNTSLIVLRTTSQNTYAQLYLHDSDVTGTLANKSLYLHASARALDDSDVLIQAADTGGNLFYLTGVGNLDLAGDLFVGERTVPYLTGSADKNLVVASIGSGDASGIEIVGNVSAGSATVGYISFHNVAAAQSNKLIAQIAIARNADSDSGQYLLKTSDGAGTLVTSHVVKSDGHFWYISNAIKLRLISSALHPETDESMDLGTTSLAFNSAFVYNLRVVDLAGVGIRMATIDADGDLGVATIPVSPILGGTSPSVLLTYGSGISRCTTGAQYLVATIALTNAEYEGSQDGTRIFEIKMSGSAYATSNSYANVEIKLGSTSIISTDTLSDPSDPIKWEFLLKFTAISSTQSTITGHMLSRTLSGDDEDMSILAPDVIIHGTEDDLKIYVDTSAGSGDSPYVKVYSLIVTVLEK